MSCPYLEKGRLIRCHAFGEGGIEVGALESEHSCFSGEFSNCPFLFSQAFTDITKRRRPMFKEEKKLVFSHGFMAKRSTG